MWRHGATDKHWAASMARSADFRRPYVLNASSALTLDIFMFAEQVHIVWLLTYGGAAPEQGVDRRPFFRERERARETSDLGARKKSVSSRHG